MTAGSRGLAESGGNDAVLDVLVQAAQAFYFNPYAGLLGDFAPDSLFKGFVQF